MTFKTLLSQAIGSNGLRLDTHGNVTITPGINNYNRADYYPSHGFLYKGGYHNIKAGSAINALTLLAFLFFLNLLQSCLKENVSTPQPPIVIFMAGDNATDMNGTKIIRTKRDARLNDYLNISFDIPTMDSINQNTNEVTTETNIINAYNYAAQQTPEQIIQVINNNVNDYWTDKTRTLRTNNIVRTDKSIDQDIFNFFKSFYTDEDSNNTNNITTNKPSKVNKNATNNNKNKNDTNFKDNFKKSDKKDKRINDRVSDLQEHEYDAENAQQNEKDSSLFQSLMWKTMESFKPGLRESAEETVCCKLIACESSRLSKKLGGYVKYLMNRYVKKGLEWVCKTEEQDIKHAFRIGREGKSCADEIEECKPKNFITDFVLFIDYLIV